MDKSWKHQNFGLGVRAGKGRLPILEHPSATPLTTLLGSGLHILQIVYYLSNIRGAEDIRFAKTCFAAREIKAPPPGSPLPAPLNPLDILLASLLFVGSQIFLNSLELDVYKLLVDGCKGGCITILKVKNHMQAGTDENLFIARVVSSKDGAPLIPPEYQPCVIYRVFARDDLQVRACNAEACSELFRTTQSVVPRPPTTNVP